MRSAIRYSEAFKLQVLRDLEDGRFASREEAKRAYGIRGQGTIESWAAKYGRSHILGKVIRVETPKDVSELQQLRKRVKDLEKALANAHLKGMFDEAYLKIACRAAGIDSVEDFKKKHDGKL